MKKILLVLLLLIVTVILGVLLQNKYNSYQTKKEHEAAAEAAKVKQAEQEKVLLREDYISRLEKETARLHAECKKGAGAYDLLTQLSKTKVNKPECAKIFVP